MPRNLSERIPRILMQRRVAHSWNLQRHVDLRLQSVTPKLWRLTLVRPAGKRTYHSKNFRDFEEAKSTFHAFPDNFLNYRDTPSNEGWYHDTEAQARGA